jgi:hypothetical protein
MQSSRPAKLEKADILEMTVQHLQWLHEQQKQWRQKQRQRQEQATPEAGVRASPELQEKTQSATAQESNNHRIKPKCEYHEEGSRLQRPSLAPAAPNCYQRQREEVALSAHPSVTSGVQKVCHEGSSSLKFRAGFRECVRQAREALSHFDDDINPAVCERLSSHLASCLDSLENGCDDTEDSSQEAMPEDDRVLASSVLIQTPRGLALMPTKLPNGDLAFIIPAYIKNTLTSCLNREHGQSCPVNYELRESRCLQEGVVWRPW